MSAATDTDATEFRIVQNTPSCHLATLRRLLFIFAKHNPQVGYTQGMNEIVAALYYVLNTVRCPDFELSV